MKRVDVEISRKDGCEDLPLPRYMSEHAAGMDVVAAIEQDAVLAPGDIKLVPAGFTMALPPGYEAQIRPRSGLALKHGVTVANAPGTIDADYRGEVGIILTNIGRQPFTVRRGDRIAQMVVKEVTQVQWIERAALDETARSTGGFGHTGR